jgi:hypothetical protein
LNSDLLELSPHYEKNTFKPLTQNYSVTIDGALIQQDLDEFDSILTGIVTID